MKSFMALLTMIMAFSTSALAYNWVARVSCDNGQFVVDGFHSYERGFVAHQAVIRNMDTVRYFESLVKAQLSVNSKNELILPIPSPDFSGEFKVDLIDVKKYPDHPEGLLYQAVGHFISNNQYEVYVTRFSHYPGMTYHLPEYVGKWIFNNCQAQ